MKKDLITREYLESLSFSDLLELSDKYEIDVPENLNRNFLIGELLEFVLEEKKDKHQIIISNSDNLQEIKALPETYNYTEISVLLRNPVWLYVFWDFNESDILRLKQQGDYSLFLRVLIYENIDSLKCSDSYEIQISLSDKDKYVLCPTEKKYIKIELCAKVCGKLHVLAISRIVEIPYSAKLRINMQPGKNNNLSKVASLSGMQELLQEHYIHHRQLFS